METRATEWIPWLLFPNPGGRLGEGGEIGLAALIIAILHRREPLIKNVTAEYALIRLWRRLERVPV